MAENAQGPGQRSVPQSGPSEQAVATEIDVGTGSPPPSPMRKVMLVALGLLLVLFTYHVLSDRFTPYTSQARVEAYLTALVNNQTRFVEVPPPVRVALHEEYEPKIYAAGIERAAEMARTIRSAADSTREARQPQSQVPLPQPGPGQPQHGQPQAGAPQGPQESARSAPKGGGSIRPAGGRA